MHNEHGYHPEALRAIIRCALGLVDLWSLDAEELLLGTAAQETHLGRLGTRQMCNGPARSIYQIEGLVEQDVWNNFLIFRPEIVRKIAGATGFDGPSIDRLQHDIVYATIIARLVYRRARDPLPQRSDVQGMAAYWKQHYNTPKGKGTAAEFVENYLELVQCAN